MSVILSNNIKTIELDVINYEFPNKIPENDGFDYDANWLVANINFSLNNSNNVISTEYFILTSELSEIIDSIKKILNCEKDSFKTNFLEPFFDIFITRLNNNKYEFSIKCDEDACLSEICDENRLKIILNDFCEMYQRFPRR